MSRSSTNTWNNQADQVSDVSVWMSEDQKDAARRVIASSAVGESHEDRVADARLMMKMLGIHSSQKGELDYFGGSLNPPAGHPNPTGVI